MKVGLALCEPHLTQEHCAVLFLNLHVLTRCMFFSVKNYFGIISDGLVPCLPLLPAENTSQCLVPDAAP